MIWRAPSPKRLWTPRNKIKKMSCGGGAEGSLAVSHFGELGRENHMITLLSRIFIKNHDQAEDQGVRRAYGMLCSIVGIGLNVLLFMGKCDTSHQDRVSVVSDRFKRYHVNFIICRCKISAGWFFGDFI